MVYLGYLLLLLVTGSAVFTVLAILAAIRYRAVRPLPAAPESLVPISILKPLHGLDEGLEENLRSFFEQDYPDFEMLFGVESEQDQSVAVVRRLCEAHPKVAARLVITGRSPYPNAKVHNLRGMLEQARHDLIVMADSDVRVTPEFLRIMAAEMSGPNVALITCPYRAVAGASVWSRLEALGLNTEFIAGVLTARMLGGMDFALGPTIATRQSDLATIGGLAELQPYLAEDFVMGNRLAARGRVVVLSSYAIEHRIGSQALGPNFAHRLRWNRSTRRSRPAGYIGQLFTYPLPLALAFAVIAAPLWGIAIWGGVAAVFVLRYIAAWTSSRAVGTTFSWLALPLQDLLSAGMWAAGFYGNQIIWRSRKFTIDREGRFHPSGIVPGRTDAVSGSDKFL
jgi:ceramide glucosyltransferase